MKEQEYIIASDRMRLTDATKILGDIVPAINPFIDKDKFSEIITVLLRWERELLNSLEIDNDTEDKHIAISSKDILCY